LLMKQLQKIKIMKQINQILIKKKLIHKIIILFIIFINYKG
jgi:hypothetical protein